MTKYTLGNATMNESELQRVYNYQIYPRVSRHFQTKDLLV